MVFSSSLPEDVQLKALHQVPGFEKAKFSDQGYAIEYDYFPPTQLKHTLETKLVENLYILQDKSTEQLVMKKQLDKV